MSRTKHHRGQRIRWIGYDLWSKRPCAGDGRTTKNKAWSRRLERAQNKHQVRNTDIDDWDNI